MSISLKKVAILLKKDMVDLLNNPNILVVCLIPVLFGFIYTKMGLLGKEALFTISLMNMSMVPLMLSSSTIAEEKEKNTLRTLMLSNISAGEFLISKAFMAIVMLDLTGALIFVIAGVEFHYLLGYILITTFCSIPIILIGCAIGIISRDQMTSGLYQVPVMLIILLPVMLAPINKTVEKIAQVIPTNAYIKMFLGYFEGNLLTGKMAVHYIVILAWILAATGVFYFCYKKNGIDN